MNTKKKTGVAAFETVIEVIHGDRTGEQVLVICASGWMPTAPSPRCAEFA